jgi:uncharacterized protein YdeI (YjbR/CyaY-like superfamily)
MSFTLTAERERQYLFTIHDAENKDQSRTRVTTMSSIVNETA